MKVRIEHLILKERVLKNKKIAYDSVGRFYRQYDVDFDFANDKIIVDGLATTIYPSSEFVITRKYGKYFGNLRLLKVNFDIYLKNNFGKCFIDLICQTFSGVAAKLDIDKTTTL